MSNIEENLAFILSSRYGKDVRQVIHDAIHDCYEDGKAGAVDLIAREQIANLVANTGDGSKDSELVDIRVGYNGTEYQSAGEAVRGQIGSLSEDILELENDLYSYVDISNVYSWKKGRYNTETGNSEASTSQTYVRTVASYALKKNDKIFCDDGYEALILYYNSTSINSYVGYSKAYRKETNIDRDSCFIRIVARKKDISEFDEISEISSHIYILSRNQSYKAFVKMSDYIQIGDYITDTIFKKILEDAYKLKVPIFIDGTFKVAHNTNFLIDKEVEIYGGKLECDSFNASESLVGTDVFTCNTSCKIHDIEFVSVADQIPSLNLKNGQMSGSASDRKAIHVVASYCTFYNITISYMTAFSIVDCININISNIIVRYAELGIYASNSSFNLNNFIIANSNKVYSEYYHTFYLIDILNTNISNGKVTTSNNAEYTISDVFHMYNPSENGSGENVTISNISITGNYNRLLMLNDVKRVILTNICGSFLTHIAWLTVNCSALMSNCFFEIISPETDKEIFREHDESGTIKVYNCIY